MVARSERSGRLMVATALLLGLGLFAFFAAAASFTLRVWHPFTALLAVAGALLLPKYRIG